MARSDIECHRCWPLAVDEAAHAVLGVLFGLRLQRMKIDLRSWQGRITFEAGFPPGKWRQDLLVSLAGEIPRSVPTPADGLSATASAAPGLQRI